MAHPELPALREQLYALGVETVIPSNLTQVILAASPVTLWRWRQNGDIPPPPLKNRYPLSWLLDLMAARTPGGRSTVVLGAVLAVRLTRSHRFTMPKLSKLTGLGKHVLVALERGDLDPSDQHLRSLRLGLGLSLIDLYRLGRVAQTLEALRVL